MESQRINILLDKYFEAATTLEEENELINYFNSGNVDEKLKSYASFFAGLKQFSSEDTADLSEELMNHILQSEKKKKIQLRLRTGIITAIAASVIVGLLAVNFIGNQTHFRDTYKNPDQAYVQAYKTLEFVAGKYNKGVAGLEKVNRLEDGTKPLSSGMEALSKGLNKLENFKKL